MNLFGARLGFRRDERGVAAIEFAIIVPVLLALLASFLELGLWYRAYDAANRLASLYAISWADCAESDPASACSTEANIYMTTFLRTNLAPALVSGNTTLRMFKVTVRANGTTIDTDIAKPSGATLSAAEQTAIRNKLGAKDEGVLVSVTYTHSLQFFASASSFLAPLLTTTSQVIQLKEPDP